MRAVLGCFGQSPGTPFLSVSEGLDQTNGVCRHAKPLARKAEMLLGGGLDVDLPDVD